LFLFLSQSSCKECSGASARSALTGSEFISESSGGIPLFSFPTEVQVRHRSRARCAQAGWKFRTCQPRRGFEDCCRKELHRVKGFKYLDVFEECRKECMQKSHRRFELVKGSSGELASSRYLKNRKGFWSSCRGIGS
jgi:hypothetical protein